MLSRDYLYIYIVATMPNSLIASNYRPIVVSDLVNAETKENRPKVANFLWGLPPIKEEAKKELILPEMEVQLEKMVEELLKK
jgi:hypothetical protein